LAHIADFFFGNFYARSEFVLLEKANRSYQNLTVKSIKKNKKTEKNFILFLTSEIPYLKLP
jgi:hypothetical protein